jgi:hypothetical protein
MAYALAHEDLRRQVEETTATSYAAGAAWLSAGGNDLPMHLQMLGGLT